MKNYIVFEEQFNADGTCGIIHFEFDDRGAAEDKYIYLRGFARQSAVLVHTVVWMDNRGNTLEKVSYTHPVPPEPEGEEPDAE